MDERKARLGVAPRANPSTDIESIAHLETTGKNLGD
jgi:hypothetical protein